MGDTNTSTPAGQAPEGAQPQVGNVVAGNVVAGQTTVQAGAQPQVGGNGAGDGQQPNTQTQQSQTLNAEALAAELARVRQEAAAARVKLKTYEDAQLSEQQKLQRDLEEMRSQASAQAAELQRLRVERAVEQQARQLGCIDPDMAMMAIWASLQFDSEGRPTNTAQALQALQQSKPYLFGQPGAQGAQPMPLVSAGSPANPPRGANAAVFTESQLRDTAFYAAHQREIDQAIRDGRIIKG